MITKISLRLGRLISYLYLSAFALAGERLAFGCFTLPGKAFSSSAHIVGARNTEEYVPASKPNIIGSANTLISGTPMMATMAIMISVVSVVFIERQTVSFTDLFAIYAGLTILPLMRLFA